MKNVKQNEIKKCIFKRYHEFRHIIEDITDGLMTCDYDLDGICMMGTEKADETGRCWNGNILAALSNYFEADVTSFHADDADQLCVWICYK